MFLAEQPDLDWSNVEVQAAMHDVLRFWLDRGVDGFRADVVHLIGKDPAMPDHLDEAVRRAPVFHHDYPGTHELLRGIRSVLDDYPGDRAMVGEVNLGSARLLAPYYGDGDELHLVFNFSLLRAPWDAARWLEVIEEAEAALSRRATWPVWVLGNHDTPRLRTRYGDDAERARVAAVVLLTLRGTPFLYAGDELGLLDAGGARGADRRSRPARRLPGALALDRRCRPRLAGGALAAVAAGGGRARCGGRAGRRGLHPVALPSPVAGAAGLAGAAVRRMGQGRRPGRRPGLRARPRGRQPPGRRQLHRCGGDGRVAGQRRGASRSPPM